jgi:hypothetical protein
VAGRISGLAGGTRYDGCWKPLLRFSIVESFWPMVSPGRGQPQCMYATWKRSCRNKVNDMFKYMDTRMHTCQARQVMSNALDKWFSSTLSSLCSRRQVARRVSTKASLTGPHSVSRTSRSRFRMMLRVVGANAMPGRCPAWAQRKMPARMSLNPEICGIF